jgi:hypothetical protein
VKIGNIELSRDGERARVSARIEWEDSPRPPLALFWETDGAFGADMEPEPNAFLAACFLPAMRHGERRIAVDATLCPALSDGLATAARLLASWTRVPRPTPRIEPGRGFRSPRPRRPPRSAAFLTGGIDSLHLFVRNRADYPPGHPARFRDAVAVFGLYSPDQVSPAEPFAGFGGVRQALAAIAADAGVALVPIATNVTALEPDYGFLADEFLAAALVSAAHLFTARWSDVSLASGRDTSILALRGSHPLLDPCFSSGALDVLHVGIGFRRQEKLAEVVRWDAGVRDLFVCMNQPPGPHLNCGRCEKCLRTMTALETFGRLPDALQFPQRTISAKEIRAAGIHHHVVPYWMDFVLPLRARGRDDLAEAIESAAEQAERLHVRWHVRGWRRRARAFDRRFLGGVLHRVERKVRRRG